MQQSQRFTKFENGLDVLKPKSVIDCQKVGEEGDTAEGVWDFLQKNTEWACEQLQRFGIPTEDIRGLYPTNIKTNIIQSISYSALRRMLSHRLCTQAQQQEWGPVARQIKEIVTNYDPVLGEALQPACVVTGKCAFDTILDRPCPIRDTL
jgi:thymidylate synthase ThyX